MCYIKHLLDMILAYAIFKVTCFCFYNVFTQCFFLYNVIISTFTS